tara:strand:+ start:1131 stop:1421 length:291 start_codon:yes stop_codon:yes gene_type:complete
MNLMHWRQRFAWTASDDHAFGNAALGCVLLMVTSLPMNAAAQANDAGAAARKAAELTGGRIVDVQTSTDNGDTVYMVKVLMEDGRVKVVSVPGVGP